MGTVLLEYLRTYECALSERQSFLNVILQNSSAQQNASIGNSRDTYNEANASERQTIARELSLARATLDRTLLVIGGMDRLRPLTVDIECLKRTSLDIRNITGLISQTSMCLPRVRDARGSLQDLPSQ